MRNKRAVSLMLSYVLLIIIGIALSIGVYSWLKFVVKGTEGIEKCPEGISLVIMDYKLLENKKIELNVKNKGLFNISGYYIKGTDDKNQEAWFNLKDVMAGSISSAVDGTYLFLEPLPPNAENSHVFLYDGLDKLEKIELEPFRIQEKESLKKKKIVLCEQGVISQEISLECRVDEDCDSYEEIYCDSLIGDVYKRDYSCINNKCIPGYSELITPCTGLCVFKSCINGLVSFWRFDETDGIAYDSANGNNGKIYGNTRLLMHFDESSGNPQDGSAYNNSGVITGATWAGSGCQSGSCLNFDGNDYVTISDSSSLEPNNITIEAWVKGQFSGGDTIINKGSTSCFDGKNGWSLRVDSSNNLQAVLYTGTDTEIILTGTTTLQNSIWYHAALTYDGAYLKIYLNGTQENSLSVTGNIDYTGGFQETKIGTTRSGGLFWNLTGEIDEAAIYSKALSQSEIAEHFNAGRAKFIERVPGKSAKFGTALRFNGVDNYANVSDADNLDINGSITISSWVKLDYLSSYKYILAKRGPVENVQANYGLRIYTNATGNYIDFYYRSGIGWEVYRTLNVNLLINQWYYIAVTYTFGDGASIKIYLNDVQLPGGSWVLGDGNSMPVLNNMPVTIGGLTNNYFFNGSIDEVMVFNQALSQENITSIYRYYTG